MARRSEVLRMKNDYVAFFSFDPEVPESSCRWCPGQVLQSYTDVLHMPDEASDEASDELWDLHKNWDYHHINYQYQYHKTS